MAKYQTEQRRLLHVYLATHAERLHTAGEIANALVEQGISISAVYRNLAEMEREGEVVKCLQKGSRSARYRYTPSEPGEEILAMTCRVCGRVVPMGRESADHIVRLLEGGEGFVLEPHASLIVGICSRCHRKRARF